MMKLNMTTMLVLCAASLVSSPFKGGIDAIVPTANGLTIAKRRRAMAAYALKSKCDCFEPPSWVKWAGRGSTVMGAGVMVKSIGGVMNNKVVRGTETAVGALKTVWNYTGGVVVSAITGGGKFDTSSTHAISKFGEALWAIGKKIFDYGKYIVIAACIWGVLNALCSVGDLVTSKDDGE